MLLQEGDHCLFCTGYPIFVALATANLDSVYVIPRSRQINQTTVGDKRLSLCLRAFSVSHLHSNNICASWMLNSSTSSERSPAAMHFLVDYFGFGLHSHTLTQGIKKKEQMTPNIFIGITVWNVAESVTQSQSL